MTQHLDRESRIVRNVDREREVGFVGQHVVDQLVEVVGLGQPHVDIGHAVAHPRQHVREQLRRRRLERADDQPPGEAAPEQLELVVHSIDAGEHGSGVVEHGSTGGGQLGRAWAPGPIEEGDARRPFELSDLLADRRLREAEVVRRSGEGPLVDDGDERRQLAWIGLSERGH